MTQAKVNLNIDAVVFGSQQAPVVTTIPSNLKGSEIKNFLSFSHKLQIPEGSTTIIKIAADKTRTTFHYRIIDDDKDLSKYSKFRTFSILFYPPSMKLLVHCADSSVKTIEFPSKQSSEKIVKKLCKDFKLCHNIAYALYGDRDKVYDPIPPTKSILEYNPYLTDVWLLRRFWIKAATTLKAESDIHFCYSHAKIIVFSRDFNYKFYNWEELIAISFAIEYSTFDQTKAVLKQLKKDKKVKNKEDKKTKKKKSKKDDSSQPINDVMSSSQINPTFPYWFTDDKKLKKKKKGEVIERVKKYERRDCLELKKEFLHICFANKFFGALVFDVHCSAPGNSTPGDYSLSFTEEKVHLLEKGTEKDVFTVLHPLVKKWRPTTMESLSFFLLLHPTSKEIFEWKIDHTENSYYILDYYTSLANFIKQQSILEKKDEHTLGTRKPTVRMTQTSLNEILVKKDSALNYDENEIDINTIQGDDHITLPRIDPPPQQTPTFLDASKIVVPSEANNVIAEFNSFFDHTDGFNYEPDEYLNVNNDVIATGCNLLKSIIVQESISPIADATTWVQSVLPEDLLTQSVLGWQLQGPAENHYEALSTISRCVAYVFQSELTPLDRFVALNYARSLLTHFARQRWKTVDFVEMADQVDEALGSALRPLFNITRRLIYPLSTLVYEDSSDILPDARSMLYLNETIVMLNLFSAFAIAQALCDAGIGGESLRPILVTLPVVNTYDHLTAYILSDALMPLLEVLSKNEVAQKALLNQPHAAKFDMQNISTCITELYNFTHFLNTSVGVFCTIKSPRVLVIPETPSTIPEAAHIFQIARETAFALWNLSHYQYASLAKQIAWVSAEFYTLFIEAARDPSHANALGSVFKILVDCLSTATEIFKSITNISDVLNYESPVHEVLMNLFNTSEDQKAILSLLALDSVSAHHRISVLEDTGSQIDEKLRSISGILNPQESQVMSDLFRVFSQMVLSLSRDAASTRQLRIDIGEFGAQLYSVFNDEMDENARKRHAQELVSILRRFINIGKSYTEFQVVQIDTSKITTAKAKAPPIPRINTSFEVSIQVTVPDLSISTETLQKIAAILRRFSL